MPLLSVVLLAAAPAAESRRNPITAELTSMFISACIDGELRLSRDGIRKVGARDVERFWNAERDQRDASYYKITKPANAALIISDYARPTEEGFKRTCTLVTTGHDIETAWYAISASLDGKPANHIPDTDIYTIDHPSEGYKVKIRSWVLSVGHYRDEIVKKARSRPEGPKKMTVTAEDSIFE